MYYQVVKGHNKTRIESSHFNEDDTVSFSPPRFSFRMMQLDQQIDLGQWDDPRWHRAWRWKAQGTVHQRRSWIFLRRVCVWSKKKYVVHGSPSSYQSPPGLLHFLDSESSWKLAFIAGRGNIIRIRLIHHSFHDVRFLGNFSGQSLNCIMCSHIVHPHPKTSSVSNPFAQIRLHLYTFLPSWLWSLYNFQPPLLFPTFCFEISNPTR